MALGVLAGGHGEHQVPGTLRSALAQALAFMQEFDGAPSSPEPWRPTDWDVQIHDNVKEHWKQYPPTVAQHGTDCSAPPATHPVASHEQAVFVCNNHLMTATYGDLALIFLTPDRLVDFSAGEAVVRFDLSTLRTSSRDWVDLWVTPYEENMALPNDETGDLNGPPRRAVHIEMSASPSTFFYGEVYRDFALAELPRVTDEGLETVLAPSAASREPFELRISRTRIRFGLPDRNLWWLDAPVADLGWSRGVVQFGHKSYNVEKGCLRLDPATGRYDDAPEGPCQNTWHWDNVRIEPAVPFTILRADRRYVDATTAPGVAFPAPAPPGAHLRFGGVGNALEVSFDDGATWRPAQAQAQRPVLGPNGFGSYWTPAPTGTTEVHFRGRDSTFAWMARDISIFAAEAPQP